MRQAEFNEMYRQRTKKMALAIIKLSTQLKGGEEVRVMRKQLLRSCTSVGANFRASCRGRSEAETYSKLCIVVEEADETIYWLELLKESNLISNVQFQPYMDSTLEILKVMSSYRKRLKVKLGK